MMGDDPFSLREELARWRDAFVEKFGDTDLEELDGETTPLEQIAGAVQATPFLSEKRFVIVKNFLSTQKAESANALVPLLDKIPESTVLVLAELGSPDQRIAAFKAVSGQATKRMFMKPSGGMLHRWVQKRAETAGAPMSLDTAAYLASTLGDNLFALNSEVQKLALYANGHPISTQMVEEVVTRNVQQSIFTLTDQLARKDYAGVLKTIRELQNQGEEAGFIFSMITRQFRLMLEMRALSEEGQPPTLMARKMGVHPFVVQNTLRFAKNFTAAEMRRALSDFLEIDRRLKTGLLLLKPREEDPYLLALERALLQQSK